MSLRTAYFTMEIGLQSDIPTFAGGLGMLAADLMRSAADMGVQAACMTLCWQYGYLHQELKADGTQTYQDISWKPTQHLKKRSERVTIRLEGRDITIGVWQKDILGERSTVPVFFLDTNLEENLPQDREITRNLYGGDGAMRIRQEAVLGIGGVRMLRALGYADIGTFHMNEGHAAFLTLELLRERNWHDEDVKRSCAFTTHTPVKAGHDVFGYELAYRIMGDLLPWHIRRIAGQEALSMTQLALSLSRYTCGVSRIHGAVSRAMFPGHAIDAITNGVHAVTWASPEIVTVLDSYCAGWKQDPSVLTHKCRDIPDRDMWEAHEAGKHRLISAVNKRTGSHLSPDCLTIGSARRVVSYKRPELLYTNLKRLTEVGRGKLQIIHAGNAHPSDAFGQDVIRRMIERSHELRDAVSIVYLPNYNPDLAKLLVQGVDVWLNTPMRLHEASGTSGMKACVNGTLNLSTLDGWWAEAYEMDPEAGWRIGPLASALDDNDTRIVDAEDLYTQLQYEVIPEYHYPDRERWIRRMKRSVGLVGYFSTHRCIREYVERAWPETCEAAPLAACADGAKCSVEMP